MTYDKAEKACQDLGRLFRTTGYVVTLHSPTLPSYLDQFLFENLAAQGGRNSFQNGESEFSLPRGQRIWLGLEGYVGEEMNSSSCGKVCEDLGTNGFASAEDVGKLRWTNGLPVHPEVVR